ncbi:MAG: hypothetical protein CMK32_09660 [Porticoccaceae bacterium]|nr:hypothetical protein [Porticoccaceae bacterium]
MDRLAQHRARIIEMCDKYDEIGPLDDGYQHFWIKDRGAMSAADLRVIADELDRRNKAWDDQITAFHKERNDDHTRSNHAGLD